jgi:nicotinamidase-related amidase
VIALVLIDLQNDYFEDEELARCRDDLVKACNRLIEKASRAAAVVVEVQTVHSRDRGTWALNMIEDGEGVALEGSWGAQRLEGLLKADLVVVKTRDSAFHATELAGWLSARGVEQVVLAGVSTESCVAATATDAYANDLRVTLVQDATASIDPGLHAQTLERLRAQYRQKVQRESQVSFQADSNT